MPTYAQVTADGTVRDLVVLDTAPVTSPTDIYSYHDVTAASPAPQPGWKTPDAGKSWQPWSAPNPPPTAPQMVWATEQENNAAYLAIIGPSDEDDAKQIAALTRQVSALIAQVTHTPVVTFAPPAPPTPLNS